MGWLPALGVLIVVLGLALGSKYKINPLLAVLAGGIVSGILGGLSITEILETIGTAFVSSRTMILFLIMLPAIGIAEKHGLMEQMKYIISKLKGATPGRISYVYQLIREISVATGMRLGGHAAFVKPIIAPMAEAALLQKIKDASEEKIDTVKAMTAAAENFGNFFAQNIFPAAAGILLIQGVMEELGYSVQLTDLARASIPIGIITAIYGFVYFMILDRKVLGGETQ
ncbi:DUF969 domain-containing protein [Thermococcus aggregans]|uniref:DUF969 domain-containing protein n=1 Tax=Thermococcus aggregans TaxID=110163 RepID=A0A9E7MXC2_THEAG|nr:DUF969 domain-containing protein [Thermococcus aggregans]USS40491.1 DUF969 domain-containing protein [Thermococcus aggregans]